MLNIVFWRFTPLDNNMQMKYIQMHWENWCLTNVWGVAFCRIWCERTFLLAIWFYCIISRYEICKTPFSALSGDLCLCQNSSFSMLWKLIQIVLDKMRGSLISSFWLYEFDFWWLQQIWKITSKIKFTFAWVGIFHGRYFMTYIYINVCTVYYI